MKKNRIALLILLLLAVVASYFIFTNTGSTIKAELRDFAISDTASVDKIFIADKSGSQVLLKRKSADEWTVNERHPARQDAINLLLYTMKVMEVRSPVAKAARDYIVKSMASHAIKVEVFQSGKLSKTFYVGGATQDQLGTYMYLQNSSVPFIMHIPGFDGYLTPRFITTEADWKIKSVFSFRRGEISRLAVNHVRQPRQSFVLNRINDENYSLSEADGNAVIPYSDTARIHSYLASYQFINYEKPLLTLTARQTDSLVQAGPVIILEASSTSGANTRVELFLKPAEENRSAHYTQDGKLLPFDPDRLIARINRDTSLVVCQYYVFDKLMVTLDELTKPVKRPVP